MEISGFFKLLGKHKYTLIIIPLVAIIITFFLVRNQPDVYTSQTQIATGIVDQTQQTLGQESMQESKINQEFSNIIALIRSKKMLDQVSYQLMIHDLTSNQPFRKPSKLLAALNGSAKQHAIEVYTKFFNNRASLSLFDKDQKGLYEVISSMKYDEESLIKTLTVYRTDNSDFITVQEDADDPQMAAFVVNTLCKQTIDYYDILVKTNQQKASTYLGELLKAKQDSLNNRMNDLKQYKIRNHVFNLNEQARALYGEITDFETKLEQAKKYALSYQAASDDIDKKFNPSDRKYMESAMVKVNNNIVNTRTQLEAANNRYVQSSFDARYKAQVDSLQRVLTAQINHSTDQYITNPLSTKQNLVQEKLTLQIQQQLAKNSVASMQKQLDALNQRLYKLVPFEAVVQAYESAITVASQEYLEILQKYNQTNLESNFTTHLRQVDTAMPGGAQPSKKMLLVILSGIISFVFCLFVFFVLFLLDSTFKNPRELANRTKVPVIGYLNLLETATIDLNRVWNERTSNADVDLFRNLLQSIRFEVSNELGGDKVLLINSITEGEGKTYLAMNLAYAYAAINKRVLIIDGNLVHAGITELTKPKQYLEDYLNGHSIDQLVQGNSKINVLGNRGGSYSLLEIAGHETISKRIQELTHLFDIIIVETPALDTLNKAKEWILFGDKIVTVFEAGQSFKELQQINLEYLKSFNERFIGWVMNMVTKEQLSKGEKS